MKITDSPENGPEAFEEALRAVDWGAFVPERDLVPLRAALVDLERRHGVVGAHRYATERILERGALLRHPDVHQVELTAQALSPAGRYLAVGDFGGDDYERGATLQIWEVTTGRCVNVIDWIVGGIGWPGYGEVIQWSADESRLAVVYRSNNVGVWDPFGEDNEPVGTARLTYSGRPDPFAFAPDGEHAYVRQEADPGAHGAVVPLDDGAVWPHDPRIKPLSDGEHEEHEGAEDDEWYDEDEDEGEDDEDRFVLERVVWSRDGRRLYGNLYDGRVCSIDAESGRVIWMTEGDRNHDWPCAEWSPDERLLAFHHGGNLVIADALTGRRLSEGPGYGKVTFMSWGARLAVVECGSRVGVVDGTGRHRYDLDLAPRQPGYALDVRPWAWEPDGDRAACLTAEGRVEIWSLGDEGGERLASFEAPEGALGVHWGADGVLVTLGPKVLRFLRADSGEVIGDFTLLRQPLWPRPLVLGQEDFGADMYPEPNPAFALDDETWAAALLPGVVIAPPGREDDLAATLAWAVDRRFAWPVHWGELEVVPDAAAAAGRVPEPLREYLEPFLGQPPEPGPQEWPPPDTATMEDLFRAFRETVVEYGVDRANTWAGAALHVAAVIRALRGETAGALELIGTCLERRRPRVAAEVAMLLASSGLEDDARSVFAPYEAAYEGMWGESPATAGCVGAAYALLGDGERAGAWFDRAREKVRENHGDRDHALPIVRALMECRRADEARALLAEGTGAAGDDVGVPFLGYLLRKGEVDLAEELLRSDEGWFRGWKARQLLVEHGLPGLLAYWGDRHDCSVEEDLPIAERNAAHGRPAGPGGADVEALSRARAELLRTPPARRQHPTAGLALTAAECRHLSAVLALLPELPMPYRGGIASHDRPWVAYSALRVVTTGVDLDPW
ncbi:WD40 repeat domain-containing protein [Nonomuraea sp. B12E4]|uniref:WD40 repeat domain-containing protein n=1 Tax=Nonomuraea sp. B12E4 TaxID=3153564 RepID=UPI00325E1270